MQCLLSPEHAYLLNLVSPGKFPQRRISHTCSKAMTLAHADGRHSMENE